MSRVCKNRPSRRLPNSLSLSLSHSGALSTLAATCLIKLSRNNNNINKNRQQQTIVVHRSFAPFLSSAGCSIVRSPTGFSLLSPCNFFLAFLFSSPTAEMQSGGRGPKEFLSPMLRSAGQEASERASAREKTFSQPNRMGYFKLNRIATSKLDSARPLISSAAVASPPPPPARLLSCK